MDLTEAQRAIVEAPPGARILVVAGPGTGKTYTLVARLIHLIEREGLSPGQDLLILSYSRAAVGEIRRRISMAGGDVRYARAVTFDSFATRLLMEMAPDDSWVG